MLKVKTFDNVIHDIKTKALISHLKKTFDSDELKVKSMSETYSFHKEAIHEAALKTKEMLDCNDVEKAKTWANRLSLLVEMSNQKRL